MSNVPTGPKSGLDEPRTTPPHVPDARSSAQASSPRYTAGSAGPVSAIPPCGRSSLNVRRSIPDVFEPAMSGSVGVALNETWSFGYEAPCNGYLPTTYDASG